MDTQWRFASLTVGRASALLRTGLDYSALAPVAAGLGVAVDGPLLEALRVLEQETVRLGDRRFKASLRAS
jgi:hypothetical protein